MIEMLGVNLEELNQVPSSKYPLMTKYIPLCTDWDPEVRPKTQELFAVFKPT